MTNINFIHVLTPECPPQGTFQIKEYKPNTLIQVFIIPKCEMRT